jgi:hypothetical protein
MDFIVHHPCYTFGPMLRRIVLLLSLVCCAACSEPPQKEIDRAQGALDAARAAGADQYATDSFKAAADALQQAHDAVEGRDYRLALMRALDANERALAAAREAADGKARASGQAEHAIGEAETALTQLQAALKEAAGARVPPAALKGARDTAADTEGALQEARAAFGTGNYSGARERVKDVKARISASLKEVNEAIAVRSTRRRR